MTLANNVDYRIELLSRDDGIRVQANIPETVMIGTGSQWEPRMPSSFRSVANKFIPGNAAKNLTSGLMWANNSDLIFQTLSFQSWQSSQPVEFNLTLLFDAEKDAGKEVVVPMSNLQELSLPFRQAGEILFPPGPSPIEPDRRRISIRMGRFIYIHSVIVTTVSNTFDTRYDKNGQPISGQSEITVSTINTPSREDVSTFYIANGGFNTEFGTRQGTLGSF